MARNQNEYTRVQQVKRIIDEAISHPNDLFDLDTNAILLLAEFGDKVYFNKLVNAKNFKIDVGVIKELRNLMHFNANNQHKKNSVSPQAKEIINTFLTYLYAHQRSKITYATDSTYLHDELFELIELVPKKIVQKTIFAEDGRNDALTFLLYLHAAQNSGVTLVPYRGVTDDPERSSLFMDAKYFAQRKHIFPAIAEIDPSAGNARFYNVQGGTFHNQQNTLDQEILNGPDLGRYQAIFESATAPIRNLRMSKSPVPLQPDNI